MRGIPKPMMCVPMGLLTVMAGICGIAAAVSPETVVLSVDKAQVVSISKMDLCVTHTQYSLDSWGNAAAVAGGKAILASMPGLLQNQHIYGWGTVNPNPSPGVYDWASLDARVKLMRDTGGVPVITLCRAPDWMTALGTATSQYQDIPPTKSHYDDFAVLAAAISKRYPEVLHYQVWNEMKGLWDSKLNNWDYKSYTEMYNKVYDSLKAVNPRVQVGGLYMVIEGTGSKRGDWSTEAPVRDRQWTAIDYWLKNKRGADFICLDRGIQDFHDGNRYTTSELMSFTRYFRTITERVASRSGLPVWWSEYYGAVKDDSGATVAMNASILRNMILGGASAALLWEPQQGEIGHGIFTDTRKAGGGKATSHLYVFQGIRANFGSGTELVRTESSGDNVEVIASRTMSMVINKGGSIVTVEMSGTKHVLAPFEVRFIPVP